MDNVAVDTLAKLATNTLPTTKVNYIAIQSSRELSFYTPVQVLDAHNADNWMTPIRPYLDEGTLLTLDLETKKVCTISAQYVLVDGILYQCGHSSPLLRCIIIEECNYLI